MVCAEMNFASGGTSKEVETDLWINSNPTASFANQNITLSDNISNYKRIKFVILTKANTYRSVEVSSEEFLNYNDTNGGFFGITERENTKDRWLRTFNSATSTSKQMGIGGAYKMNGSGNDNSYVRPYKIIGIK